jgi:hypothetical protein
VCVRFRRSTDTDAGATDSSATTDPAAATSGGKGRPTPKRKEAEAQRRSRVAPPKDRKEARTREREERAVAYQKLKSGDERYFPARDRGPVRAFARSWIDGRRNAAQLFWPVVIGGLVLLVIPGAQRVATSVLLLFYLVVGADTAVSLLGLRRQLSRRFPDDPARRGALMYAFGRSLQGKRRRVPPPTVEMGWTGKQRKSTD